MMTLYRFFNLTLAEIEALAKRVGPDKLRKELVIPKYSCCQVVKKSNVFNISEAFTNPVCDINSTIHGYVINFTDRTRRCIVCIMFDLSGNFTEIDIYPSGRWDWKHVTDKTKTLAEYVKEWIKKDESRGNT